MSTSTSIRPPGLFHKWSVDFHVDKEGTINGKDVGEKKVEIVISVSYEGDMLYIFDANKLDWEKKAEELVQQLKLKDHSLADRGTLEVDIPVLEDDDLQVKVTKLSINKKVGIV